MMPRLMYRQNRRAAIRTWMAGTSPAMTRWAGNQARTPSHQAISRSSSIPVQSAQVIPHGRARPGLVRPWRAGWAT